MALKYEVQKPRHLDFRDRCCPMGQCRLDDDDSLGDTESAKEC